ncbi:hypothetical protein HN807_07475 [Candidatus Bathyarchaeota archaeon]|nr:hypothetical protein [Candidatus Bathyarchaeota archaeon]MBT7346905.1 hypothetical protein [Candidatus Bathyarchaeota archaeon]
MNYLSEYVYIGSKPILNYVIALVTALQKEPTVNVMAMGRDISNASMLLRCAREATLPTCVSIYTDRG